MDDTIRRIVSYFTSRDGLGDASPVVLPKTVEDILEDFTGRRYGLLQALTTESDLLYLRCNPESDNMSLYGYANGTWKVCVPKYEERERPPSLPQPTLGINFARDAMLRQNWLCLIAIHCDSWLLSVAHYLTAAAQLGRDDRGRLFGLIIDFPTLREVVCRTK